jgi:hypothetical protein
MLSLFVRTLTIRGNQGRPRCFPSYAFSLLRADGGPIAKIKSPLKPVSNRQWKFLQHSPQNRLTYRIIAPTMQLLTCTYVLVDKK